MNTTGNSTHLWIPNGSSVKRQNFANNSDFPGGPDGPEFLGVENSLQNSSSGCSSKSSTAGSSAANSPPQNILLVNNGVGPMLNHPAVAQLQQVDKDPSQQMMAAAWNSLQQQQQQESRPSENHLYNANFGQPQNLPQQTVASTSQGLSWTSIPVQNLAAVAGLCGNPSLEASQYLAAAALMGNGQPPQQQHQQQQQQQTNQQQQQQILNMYLRGQQQTPLLPNAYHLGLTGLVGSPQPTAIPPANPTPLSTFNPQAMALSMYYLDQMNLANQLSMHLTGSSFGIGPIQNPITNVAYMNEKGQLLESLPICRDFKAGKCHRHSECRYVHLIDDNVEVNQGRVTICRDAAKGRCSRTPCKYFHIPPLAITASRSLAFANSQAAFQNPSSMLFCEPANVAHI